MEEKVLLSPTDTFLLERSDKPLAGGQLALATDREQLATALVQPGRCDHMIGEESNPIRRTPGSFGFWRNEESCEGPDLRACRATCGPRATAWPPLCSHSCDFTASFVSSI